MRIIHYALESLQKRTTRTGRTSKGNMKYAEMPSLTAEENGSTSSAKSCEGGFVIGICLLMCWSAYTDCLISLDLHWINASMGSGHVFVSSRLPVSTNGSVYIIGVFHF
jgi:hypothetical protein